MAYVLILVLGLRKGEVLGLVWDDVNLDSAELTMGYQLQRVSGQLLHRETKRFLAVSSGFGDQLMIKWCGPGVAG